MTPTSSTDAANDAAPTATRDDSAGVRERPGLQDAVGWRALFVYRELVAALVTRELTIRYKRSLFGIGWALVEPVVLVTTYVVIFGHVLDAGRDVKNYALFAFLGTSAWMFLSATLEQSSLTLIEHAPLIRKVYFPREMLVGAVVFSRLTTLLLCVALAGVLAVVTTLNGVSADVLRAPFLLVGIALLTALVFGLSLCLSSLNVIVRDTGFLVRFALRVGFYACPIVYPLSLVPAGVRPFYELNPLVGVLFFFQAAADPAVAAPSPIGLASAAIGSVGALALGVWSFRRMRSAVADLL